MNQHFIPRCLLSNFVDREARGNRGVWIRERGGAEWTHRPLKRVAALSNYYTITRDDGSADNTLEANMKRLESMATPVLRYHIEKRRRLSPPVPYDAFVTFIATLICRNPNRVERIKQEFAAHAIAQFRVDVANPATFQRLREAYHRDTGKTFPNIKDAAAMLDRFAITTDHEAGVIMSMLGVQWITERLGTACITFLCAPPGSAFVTGDIPYLRQGRPDSKDETFYVPLSPKTAAAFSWRAETKYVYVNLEPSDVAEINGEFLPPQTYVVSSRPAVLDEATISKWEASKPQ